MTFTVQHPNGFPPSSIGKNILNICFWDSRLTVMGTEATLGLRPISSVTLYRIAQYKIPLAFNALYFPYSETTHLFGVNSTD